MPNSIQNLPKAAVVTASIIGCLTVLGTLWYQKRKRTGIPTKWVPVGKVKNLYIYPLKSGRRNELETAICTEYGLIVPKQEDVFQLRDRNLIIYKEGTYENYNHSKTYLIETSAYDETHFMLNAPGMPALKVRIPTLSDNSKTGETSTWISEKIYFIDCGDDVAKWLSSYILDKDIGLRLGFHDGSRRRDIHQAFKAYFKYYSNLKNEATGMYSNLSSYLVVNQASVDDLNSRIEGTKISANNFRPNILVEDSKPYAEDNWEWLKIGNNIFYYVMSCPRCPATTIDPDTAARAQNYEPIKTLRSYRQMKAIKNIDLDGNRPIMGNRMGLLNEGGEISVGDVVYLGKY